MKMNAMKLAIALFIALAYGPAQAQVLGTAQSFAVLAGSTVTNTGSTVINAGNVGVSPGSAVTGFPPGTVTPPGTIHAGDAVAAQAQSDLTAAYNALAGLTPATDLTGQDLGDLTLTSGVYKFDSSAQLTGDLILDAQGNSNAFWVFQIGSTLTTASGSEVDVINDGGSNAPVFWQVGSSATLGTGTDFLGNIVALTSITMTTGADILCGSALARNGAVTLDTNTIGTGCNNIGITQGEVTVTPIPEPEIYAMMAVGLGFMGFVARRRKQQGAVI